MIVLIFTLVLFTFLLPGPLASTPCSSDTCDLSQQTHELGRADPIPTRLDVALRAWFQEERDRHFGDAYPSHDTGITSPRAVDRTCFLHSMAASDHAASSLSLVYTLCAILR